VGYCGLARTIALAFDLIENDKVDFSHMLCEGDGQDRCFLTHLTTGGLTKAAAKPRYGPVMEHC
jgi:hypothetical protein